MNNITKSASKLVLLSVIGVTNLLAIIAGAVSIWRGDLNEGSKLILVLFASVVTFVVGYYFGSKGDPTQPYAGK